MVAVAALPAIAATGTPPRVEDPAGGTAVAPPLCHQELQIFAGSVPTGAPRDSLGSEKAVLTPLEKAENMAAEYRLAGGVISWPMGNDYPFADSTAPESLSSMRYAIRTCTDFVAWRLNRDAGSFGAPWLMSWGYLTPTGGNGVQWQHAWEVNGWPMSEIPVVGSVAWFGDNQNHVAYVYSVNDDGTVTLEEYNVIKYEYSTRTVRASSIPLYLYPPPRP
jgi:surface antigen